MSHKPKGLTPGMAGHRAVSAFDNSRSRYAVVGHDNRVKVWDVAAGRLVASCVDPKHLAAAYTCLAWSGVRGGERDTETIPEGGKKRGRGESAISSGSGAGAGSGSNGERQLVALGTEQGSVVVWDLATCQPLEQFAETRGSHSRHSGRVNDVAFNAAASCLFSCGADGVVKQWSVATGQLLDQLVAEKRGGSVERLALSRDDATLLTAGSTIKQWDLSSKQVVRRFPGHSSSVRHLRFVDQADGSLFVSCASGDRFLSLWGAAPHYDSAEALQVFVHDSSVAYVDAFLSRPSPSSGAKGRKTSNAAAAIRTLCVSAVAETALAPHCLITQNTSGKAATDPSQAILRASFLLPSMTHVLLARATALKPCFEEIVYAQPPADQRGGAPVLLHSVVLNALKARPLPAPSGLSSAATALGSAAVAVIGQVQMPVAATVATLGSKQGRHESDHQLAVQLLSKLDETQAQRKTDLSVSRVQSIHMVLAQALRSNDHTLLEECLAISNSAIIDQTVMKLPPAHVLAFVKIVVAKFHTTPARGVALAVWIRSILEQHTAYLLTIPDLVAQLTGLYQLVDNRVSIFKKVLKLSGRLDLIVSQISKKERISNAAQPTIRASFSLNDDLPDQDDETENRNSSSDDSELDSDLEGLSDDDDDDDDDDLLNDLDSEDDQ